MNCCLYILCLFRIIYIIHTQLELFCVKYDKIYKLNLFNLDDSSVFLNRQFFKRLMNGLDVVLIYVQVFDSTDGNKTLYTLLVKHYNDYLEGPGDILQSLDVLCYPLGTTYNNFVVKLLQ